MSEQASDRVVGKPAGHAGSPQVSELADQAEERDSAVRDSEHLRPLLALVLTEMIERCDSIMGALKDLGVDGDDADFHDAFAYTENARQQIGWLRQEVDTARAAITPTQSPQSQEAG